MDSWLQSTPESTCVHRVPGTVSDERDRSYRPSIVVHTKWPSLQESGFNVGSQKGHFVDDGIGGGVLFHH